MANTLIPDGYVGIRDYATGAGGTVGWDPATKAVSINNQTLDPASYVNVGGRTYASPNTIQGILKPPEQQVVQGAGAVSGAAVGQGQQQGINVNDQSNLQGQINNILTMLQQNQQRQQAPAPMQAPAPFQYNPQTDPAYQAMVPALTRSVLEQLNARGILNSSISPDSVSQAIASIIPQLQGQAYDRYSDQARMGMDAQRYNQDAQRQFGMDQFGMSRDILNTLSGFEKETYQRQMDDRQFKIDEQIRKVEEEQKKIDNAWKAATGKGWVTNELAQLTGLTPGEPLWEARNAIDQRRQQNDQFLANLTIQKQQLTQDQAQFQSRLAQDQSQFNQSMTQRQNEAAAEQDSPAESLIDINAEKLQLRDDIKTGKMSAMDALNQIEEDERLGFYTAAEAEELKNVIRVLTSTPLSDVEVNETKTPIEKQSLSPGQLMSELVNPQGKYNKTNKG